MKKFLISLLAAVMLFGSVVPAMGEEMAEEAAVIAAAEEAARIAAEEETVEEAAVEEVAAEEETAEEEAAGMAVVEEPEDTAVPFTGTIAVKLECDSEELYYGDTVTLKAVVKEANKPYSIRWEAKADESWSTVGHGSSYAITLTEATANTAYRAVLVAEA